MWKQSKTLNAILLVANQLETADFHKVFKIAYFADRDHLANYGRTILGDFYIAMKDGPVPSRTYDLLKAFRENDPSLPQEDRALLVARNYEIFPKRIPDTDYLSATEIACLNRAIAENRRLSFAELSEKSHGTAWQSTAPNQLMSLLDIALEGHAADEMLSYIRDLNEAEDALQWL
jgi:uncharacterized phage-associated protein